MKLAIITVLVASASAFAPQSNNARPVVAMQAESSRREAFGAIAAAAAVMIPAAANAAAGESPRFSVFGLIGDGGAYSEGGAYGSDQSSPVYSAYSVYGEAGKNSSYQADKGEGIERKTAQIAESKKRLALLPAYVEKKQWFNVKDELTRYMYNTRESVRGLAKTPEQKAIAKNFFLAMEEITLQATLKNQAKCAVACEASIKYLNDFTASL